MMEATYPLYLAGKPESPNHDLVVRDKYTGEAAAKVALADAGIIDQAIDAAVRATKPMRSMPPYQ
ncbi:MAG: aldehyde dehydrogenase, partial [Planctomycetes bacterium]|nr:aldehyde dehydrogenase [Planctomycetota bacterium]